MKQACAYTNNLFYFD